MRHFYLASIAGLLFLAACNDAKKSSEVNLTKAIDQYLTKHGKACTVIGRPFPIEVSESEQRLQSGTAQEMATLEQAGLLQSSSTTAVVHGMMDALRGSTPPQPVKRYELTTEGKKYFQQVPGTFGQTNGLCYGQKTVDAIVKWTEPVTAGASSQTEVIYTYKIVNLAGWAERPDVQRAFPNIQATLTGASKTTEIAGLQLTSKGWEVPGQ
jgi:hypothetical protein